MTDAILNSDRFYSRGTPAWHGLGTVVPEHVHKTALEVLGLVGLDFELAKVPLFYEVDGRTFTVGDQVALHRHGGRLPAKQIGIVHKNYPVLQNRDIAEKINPLSERWPVETAGALHDGETIWFMLNAGETSIGTDPVKKFVLFCDQRDGGNPAYVGRVYERVVCANTLQIALGEKSGANEARITLKHFHSSFANDFNWAVDVVGQLMSIDDRAVQTMQRMANPARRLSQEDVRRLFGEVLVLPKAPEKGTLLTSAEAAGMDVTARIESYKLKVEKWQQDTERVQQMRQDLHGLYLSLTPEFERAGSPETAWHAYNAVTQFLGTYKGRLVQQSVMFGERAETNAKAFRIFSDSVNDVVPVATRTLVGVGSTPSVRPEIAAAFPEPAVAATIGDPVPTNRPIRTYEEKAAEAAKFVIAHCPTKQGKPTTFTNDYVARVPLLRRAAESWLRGSPDPIIKDNGFLRSVHQQQASGRSLSDGQVRGILNMMPKS